MDANELAGAAGAVVDPVVEAMKTALAPLEARIEAIESERARVTALLADAQPLKAASLGWGVSAEVEDRLHQLEAKTRPLLLRVHDKLKGFRTLIVGTVVAVGPALADYFGQLDPVALLGVSPKAGVALGAGMIALRVITRSAVPNPFAKE